MTGVSLRPATPADVPRLTDLVQAAYGHYTERIGGPPRPMTDDYADVVRKHRVTVAEQAGELVGLIVLVHRDDGLVIDNVAAHPTYQKTGVGRALLEHAETVARDHGLGHVLLYTHERMTENQALYRRIGYVEYERRQAGAGRIVHMRKAVT